MAVMLPKPPAETDAIRTIVSVWSSTLCCACFALECSVFCTRLKFEQLAARPGQANWQIARLNHSSVGVQYAALPRQNHFGASLSAARAQAWHLHCLRVA